MVTLPASRFAPTRNEWKPGCAFTCGTVVAFMDEISSSIRSGATATSVTRANVPTVGGAGALLDQELVPLEIDELRALAEHPRSQSGAKNA